MPISKKSRRKKQAQLASFRLSEHRRRLVRRTIPFIDAIRAEFRSALDSCRRETDTVDTKDAHRVFICTNVRSIDIRRP